MDCKKGYCQRRQNLLRLCEDGNMLLLYANADSQSFVQNNNFFYLTGLNIPNAILIIIKQDGKLNSSIFIERTIPERIVWDGEKMSPEEVKSISGIENVYYLDRFDEVTASYLAGSSYLSINKVFVEKSGLCYNEPLNKTLLTVKKMSERYPYLIFGDLGYIIKPLRMKKDEWEVEQLSKAIRITEKGLNAVLKGKISGNYEYQIEAKMHYELLKENVRNWGFKPIVAGGKNATTLHYCKNNDIIPDKSMILIDVGALYNNYSADITRTYPTGKKYPKRAKQVYSEVLQVQKSVIKMIEPGVTLQRLNQATSEMLFESAKRLGLIKNKEELKQYYMHSVSHFLGMSAHDVFTKDAILEPGNVITVEPGLYITEEGIGVRIEDDILITETGCEVLSASIPKEIEEIEAIRSKAVEE